MKQMKTKVINLDVFASEFKYYNGKLILYGTRGEGDKVYRVQITSTNTVYKLIGKAIISYFVWQKKQLDRDLFCFRVETEKTNI